MNGIEEYTGELVESLGMYDTIEDCFEANQEKLGIELPPLPSLEEKMTLAEEKATSQNADSKEHTYYSIRILTYCRVKFSE